MSQYILDHTLRTLGIVSITGASGSPKNLFGAFPMANVMKICYSLVE